MKIRQKLIATILLLSLVPAMVVGAVAYFTISRELKDRAADQVASTAIKQEQKISGILQTRQEEVIKLANRYDFQISLSRYLASSDQAGLETLTALLQDKKIQEENIHSISLVDMSGRPIVGTSPESIKTSWDQNFSKSDEETLISIKSGMADGINKLSVRTKAKINKKSVALLEFVFRMDDVVASVQDYTGLDDTGETVVAGVGSDGQVLSLFPLRFDTDAAMKPRNESLELLDKAEGAVYSGVDYRNQSVIVATRPVGFANWVVGVKMDTGEVLAPAGQLMEALVQIVVVSTGVIVLLVFAFSRSFTEPILRVGRVAKAIGAGELNMRVRVNRHDEIGALAENINSMGDSLRSYVDHIESDRNRLSVILNSTTEAILAIDKQARVIMANSAATELTATPLDDIVGKRIDDVFLWTKRNEAFAVDYLKAGENTYTDLEYSDPSSVRHFVKLITAQASGPESHEGTQTIITVHDETKSRELEAMKVDFVSMAAHELRTPLASIRGYLELVGYKEASRISDSARQYIRKAIEGTAELGDLISNLLDVTKIERGALALHMGKVGLRDEIRQCVDSSQFAASEKDIDLQYEVDDDPCYVRGDRVALHEVVNNLVSNAIKYTPVGGRVRVKSRVRDGKVVVEVVDTGIGMPAEALPNLFQKFYRVRGGLDSGSTSTGLGLYICRSIIERHSGTIGVRSQEGKGSTFTFSLPAFSDKG